MVNANFESLIRVIYIATLMQNITILRRASLKVYNKLMTQKLIFKKQTICWALWLNAYNSNTLGG